MRKKSWPPASPRRAYRYVAMCDVLGFRRLASTVSLSELASRSIGLISGVAITRRLGANMFPVTGARGDMVKAAIFSDTILLYTVPISPKETLLDIGVVSSFFDVCGDIFRLGLNLGMPVRIGISYGETAFVPSQSLFVGLPVVWAHDIETAQNWVGGACHESCEGAPHFGSVSGRWADVLAYQVPMRSGSATRWALNWTKAGSPILETLQAAKDAAPVEAVSKYIAAVAFFEWAETQLFGRLYSIKSSVNPPK
jgi:hypothetical protein